MASLKAIKAQISNLAVRKQPQPVNFEPQHFEATNINNTQIVRENLGKKVDTNLGAFLKELVPGKDFGTIPNVKQPILFKAGAQKILKFLGYRHFPTLLNKTIDVSSNLLAYTVKVTIIDKDGNTIVESLGSANSHESKFASRGLSADNMLVEMAVKRALITGVKEIISH